MLLLSYQRLDVISERHARDLIEPWPVVQYNSLTGLRVHISQLAPEHRFPSNEVPLTRKQGLVNALLPSAILGFVGLHHT